MKRQRGNELLYAETCANIFFDMEKPVGEYVLKEPSTNFGSSFLAACVPTVTIPPRSKSASVYY